MKSFKYCTHCRKVRNVIQEENEILCKHCGRISKLVNHSLNHPVQKHVEKKFIKWFRRTV